MSEVYFICTSTLNGLGIDVNNTIVNNNKMCGFIGIYDINAFKSENYVRNKLKAISENIKFRGPDDYGCWIDVNEGIGISHRRLSIQDLSKSGVIGDSRGANESLGKNLKELLINHWFKLIMNLMQSDWPNNS